MELSWAFRDISGAFQGIPKRSGSFLRASWSLMVPKGVLRYFGSILVVSGSPMAFQDASGGFQKRFRGSQGRFQSFHGHFRKPLWVPGDFRRYHKLSRGFAGGCQGRFM